MSDENKLNGEKLITLVEAARFYPGYRSNKTLNVSTVLRWILDGVKSRSGERIKLEAKRVGKRWLTSNEALNRLSEALSAEPSEEPQTIRSPTAQTRASQKAAERLQGMGA